MIGTKKTKVTIRKPDNLDDLKRMSAECHLGFDPEVVRVILPYVNCYYMGVEGEVEPPRREEMPEARRWRRPWLSILFPEKTGISPPWKWESICAICRELEKHYGKNDEIKI